MSNKFLWQSVSFSSLRIENWNEGVTVFQTDSGKTHFLNEMGLQIILNLNQSSATEDEICITLAEQFQLADDQILYPQIIETLHRFDELGLIEKIRLES